MVQAKGEALADTAYEERKVIAMGLIGQRLHILLTQDQQQKVRINGLGVLKVFPTPTSTLWGEGSPLRFIDGKQEFVFSVGWKTSEKGPWQPDTVVKVEELKGRSREQYYQDYLAEVERNHQIRKEDTEKFLEQAHSSR